MHKKTLLKKGLVVGIIVLFFGVGIHAAFAVVTKQSIVNKDEISSQNIKYIQSGNKLTRKHLIPLIINYYYIEKDSVKKIVKDIIIELIFTGDATIEEILQIVNNSDLNPTGVYILSLIETTDWSDGLADCYPGNRFVYLFGYNSRGSYVRYKKDSGSIYGWHLKIDRNEVSKKSGHAIGYYGHVHSGIAYYYPGEYPGFEMVAGFSLLVFHGC